MSEAELECQRELARAKDALIRAMQAGKEAGYGSEFVNALGEVCEALEAFRAHLEV